MNSFAISTRLPIIYVFDVYVFNVAIVARATHHLAGHARFEGLTCSATA